MNSSQNFIKFDRVTNNQGGQPCAGMLVVGITIFDDESR